MRRRVVAAHYAQRRRADRRLSDRGFAHLLSRALAPSRLCLRPPSHLGLRAPSRLGRGLAVGGRRGLAVGGRPRRSPLGLARRGALGVSSGLPAGLRVGVVLRGPAAGSGALGSGQLRRAGGDQRAISGGGRGGGGRGGARCGAHRTAGGLGRGAARLRRDPLRGRAGGCGHGRVGTADRAFGLDVRQLGRGAVDGGHLAAGHVIPPGGSPPAGLRDVADLDDPAADLLTAG